MTDRRMNCYMESRPVMNPKAIEFRSIRMSTRKRIKLKKQKEAEEVELLQEQQIQQIHTPKKSKIPQQRPPSSRTRSSLRQRQTPEIIEQRIRKSGGRVPFSVSDEHDLYEFLLNQSKYLRGNKIYEQFAKQNPRHTAQSWRDHALKKYVDRPHFIKEWEKRWFPNKKKLAERDSTTCTTNNEVQVVIINKERETYNKDSSDSLDLEVDDAAAEALILRQSDVRGNDCTAQSSVINKEKDECTPDLESDDAVAESLDIGSTYGSRSSRRRSYCSTLD